MVGRRARVFIQEESKWKAFNFKQVGYNSQYFVWMVGFVSLSASIDCKIAAVVLEQLKEELMEDFLP